MELDAQAFAPLVFAKAQPFFPTAGESLTMQGTLNSSGDENTSSFVNFHAEDAPKPSLEGRVLSDKSVSGENLTKASDIGMVVASGVGSLSDTMQIKFGVDNYVVPAEGSGALRHEPNAVHKTKIADLTNLIKGDCLGNRNRIFSESLDTKKPGSCEGENLCVGKGKACDKGLVHAIYTPGGNTYVSLNIVCN